MVISHFGSEDRILALIVSVPDHRDSSQGNLCLVFLTRYDTNKSAQQ